MANWYSWTDVPIVADTTKIRDNHIVELCDNMELVRGYIVDFNAAYGGSGTSLGASGPSSYSFTDDPVDTTDKIRDNHMNDLRVALDDINTQWASYHGAWSWCQEYSNNAGASAGNRVTQGVTKVRAIHVNELRDQLDLIDESMYSNSPFCPTSCQVACQTACQTACQYSCQGCNNSTCHDQMCGTW